jgi:hypothetical protein
MVTIGTSETSVYSETTRRRETLKSYIISLNSVNQLIFVMVKCGVLFEVRTEFLNNI